MYRCSIIRNKIICKNIAYISSAFAEDDLVDIEALLFEGDPVFLVDVLEDLEEDFGSFDVEVV